MTPATLLALLLAGAVPALPQDPPPPAGGYIRSREQPDGLLLLEVATRVFTPVSGKGPRIHLVSAVHVADAPFYAGAQERLDGFDLVLYEGIKPAGAGATDPSATPEQKTKTTRTRLELLVALARRRREEAGAFPADLARFEEGAGKRWAGILRGVLVDGWGRPVRYLHRAPADGPEAAAFASDGPDGKAGSEDDLRLEALATDRPGARPGPGIQSDIAGALGLAFQGDAMDESGPRWRSSDMSIDELERHFAAAGADATELLALLDGTSFSARMVKVVFGFVGRSPAMAALVKMTLVEALGSDAGLQGGDGNLRALMKVVIEERNAVVVADLRVVLGKEPPVGDVAVFYGAGHMKDMERRLVGELGYRPGETSWTTAIRVDPRDAGFAVGLARRIRAAMKKIAEKKAAEKNGAETKGPEKDGKDR